MCLIGVRAEQDGHPCHSLSPASVKFFDVFRLVARCACSHSKENITYVKYILLQMPAESNNGEDLNFCFEIKMNSSHICDPGAQNQS